MSEDAPLISVIIPVYNVEQYLPTCLDSVLGQTYQNLEVILVDDGSPDSSGAICDEYAARDQRIRVIHQENGGLSAARNSGLDIAKGTYIGFVDSDDYIDPNMYQTLYKHLRETGADVALCGYMCHDETGAVQNVFGSGENGIYNGLQCIEKLLVEGSPWISAWDKLYRMELFQKLRFQVKVRAGEDVPFSFQLYTNIDQLVFVKEPLYHYRSRPGTLSKPGLNHLEEIRARVWIAEWLEQNVPYLSGLGYRWLAIHSIKYYNNTWLLSREYDPQACKEAKALIRADLRKACPAILKASECSMTVKIRTCLIVLTPHLYDFLYVVIYHIQQIAMKWKGKHPTSISD